MNKYSMIMVMASCFFALFPGHIFCGDIAEHGRQFLANIQERQKLTDTYKNKLLYSAKPIPNINNYVISVSTSLDKMAILKN